jgi:hypothetical protein
VLAGFCLFISIGLAQIRSSAITGTITDPSGAVVPNATVVVTNEETNVPVEVKTNAAGVYTVPYLAAGRYSVSVQAPGFQTYRKTGIVMGTATTVRADAALVTGTLATSVEVWADANVLQTETSTVQGAVSQNIIANIPNINNNPLYYATLQAGVVPAPQMYESTRLGVGFADRQRMSAIRMNGGQLGSNEVLLDGVSVQGAAWHEATVLPDREALQEVRVITNSFAADLGNGQGVISMVTKSGTNQYHGSASYRLRNEALNANGLYNNSRAIRRPMYRVNEGGGTIGGPVIIPKLFNGKDKLFFFASFSRLTHADPVTYLGTVPTDKQRQGDFSQTKVRDNNGNPVALQIYDPFTAKPYQGSTTTFERLAYVNSIVTAPDKYGLKMLQSYPMPNRTPDDPYDTNNYRFDGVAPVVRNNLATRLDYRLGERNSIYLTGGLSNGSNIQPNRWGKDNLFNIGGTDTTDDNPYAAVGDTITLTPTMVVDIRYGISRTHCNSGFPTGTGFNYSEWGMPPAVQAYAAMPGVAPSIRNFGGPINHLNADTWNRKKERQLNHALNGSATKMVGRWTFKAGGEFRTYLGNWQDIMYATPLLQGSTTSGWLAGLTGGTSGLVTNPAQRGLGFVSALTGDIGYSLPSGTSLRPALASKYLALFTQNDWKATDKLTLNLGLRWEVQPGPTERFNRGSGVDLNRANPFAAGLTLSNPLAGLGYIAFAGRDGYSRNLWDTEYNNISPRLGAAYRLTPATVLRGGFGRNYLPSNSGFNANGLVYGTGPFSGGAQSNAYGLAPNGVPIGRFEDPQNTLLIPAPGAVQAPEIYGNSAAQQNVDLFRRDYKNGLVDQWNFFIERSFGRAWLVSAGYVGARGKNLPWRTFQLGGSFSVPDSTLKTWRDAWVASNGTTNPANVTVPNPFTQLIGKAAGSSGGTTISTQNTLLPYMALLGASVLGNGGKSNYNALQFKVEHAYSSGLQMLFTYTWSKTTGLVGSLSSASYAESQMASGAATPAGGIDYRNLDNNRGLLAYDVPHRAVTVLSYLLPTGKGKTLDPKNTFLQALVGEWNLGTVVTLQSGQPFGPSCGAMNGRCIEDTSAPVEVPKELQHWYDGKTSVTLPSGRIVTPGAYTFLKWNPDRFYAPTVRFPNGNYQVDQYWWGYTSQYINGLRTPGLANVNLTINRKFQIVERMQLEFLAEATNLFNRTNFSPTAVNAGYGAILSVPANNTNNVKIGQNSSSNSGTLGMSFYEPRIVTLSLRLRF